MSFDDPVEATLRDHYRDAYRRYPTWVEFCLGALLVLAVLVATRATVSELSAVTNAVAFDDGRPRVAWAIMAGGTFLLFLCGYVGVTYGYLRYRGQHEHVVPAVPDRRDLTWVGALVIGAVALVVAGELTARALFDVPLSAVAPVGGDGQLPPGLLLVFLLTSAFVGIGREALFRGAVQVTLRNVTAAPVAVGLTTLLFLAVYLGLWSVPTVPELAIYGTSLAVLSVALGYAMERTGNVLVPMAGHVAFQVALFGLVVATQGL